MDEQEATPLEPVETEPQEEDEDEFSEDGVYDAPFDEDAKERHGWLGDRSSANIHSDHVTAENIKVAGTMIEQLNVTIASGFLESVQLSIEHFRTRTPEELDRCEAELVFEPEVVEELRWSLEERRLLILSGEPESGKGSAALLLASQMTKVLRLEGLLTCHGLASDVQIDLEKIASNRLFSHHVVMFEDALIGESSSLKKFLKTVDSIRLATLTERLNRNGSAIVLTVSSHNISDYKNRLENIGILKHVGPPPADLLLEALRRFVEHLPQTGESREALMALVADIEGDLVRELKTIPRICRFVQEYLGEISGGKLTLRQALARMDDLSQWLTADLAGDLDAQAAALSLVLGSAVPPAIGVPWFPFEQLRRRIVLRLRQELRLSDDEPLSSVDLGRAAFLQRARAHVVPMPSPLPDLTRFRDDRYPQRLWQALLGPARELATLLLPLLKELTLDPDPFLRASAASALGRLGQIGPTYLATPILLEWTRDESVSADSLGFFLQGIASSEDKGYRDFCLGTLRQLAFQDDPRVEQAAIYGLRLLGRPDPAVPIRELCVIARSRLPIQIERLRLVERDIVAEEEKVRRSANPRRISRKLRLLHAQSHVLMAVALVPEERIRLLGAIRFSLAGVLFAQGGDPGPVLRELNTWLKAEPAKLAPLFTYLFLHRRGLIDLLDHHKWISGSFGVEPCSRFLLSASRGPEEAVVLREFLERIFSTLQVFPGLFQFILEQRFLQILRNWSQEGCRVIGLRPTVVGLLSSLRASENTYLGTTVTRFLRTDQHFTAKGSRLRALAMDVLHGRGLDPLPTQSSRPRRLPAWMARPGGETA